MIKTRGSIDFENFKVDMDIDYTVCKKPLFHGTRKYALEVDEETRKRYAEACYRVAKLAKKLAEQEKIPYNYVVDVMDEASVYEYGSFYLSTLYSNGIEFAYCEGGELGHNVYLQCLEINKLQIELEDEMKSAIELIISEHEKYAKSEKVILVYKDVKFVDLKTESGYPVVMGKGLHEIDRIYESEETDDMSMGGNYRLDNSDTYEPYVLREGDFRRGFGLFTEVTDVDGYVKNHNYITVTKWQL